MGLYRKIQRFDSCDMMTLMPKAIGASEHPLCISIRVHDMCICDGGSVRHSTFGETPSSTYVSGPGQIICHCYRTLWLTNKCLFDRPVYKGVSFDNTPTVSVDNLCYGQCGHQYGWVYKYAGESRVRLYTDASGPAHFLGEKSWSAGHSVEDGTHYVTVHEVDPEDF